MAASIQRIFARLLLPLPVIWIFSGCSLKRPSQEQRIDQLGHFEFQEPDDRMKGVIIGAPHGSAEPASGEYAKSISEKTGAGFFIAYGFGARRLAVARSLVFSKYNLAASADPVRREASTQNLKNSSNRRRLEW